MRTTPWPSWVSQLPTRSPGWVANALDDAMPSANSDEAVAVKNLRFVTIALLIRGAAAIAVSEM
jgi:hypothetical protein